MHEITIPGHYIVGIGSYDTPLDLPEDTERNFNSETKIFKILNFYRKSSIFITRRIRRGATFWLRFNASVNAAFFAWFNGAFQVVRKCLVQKIFANLRKKNSQINKTEERKFHFAFTEQQEKHFNTKNEYCNTAAIVMEFQLLPGPFLVLQRISFSFASFPCASFATN